MLLQSFSWRKNRHIVYHVFQLTWNELWYYPNYQHIQLKGHFNNETCEVVSVAQQNRRWLVEWLLDYIHRKIYLSIQYLLNSSLAFWLCSKLRDKFVLDWVSARKIKGCYALGSDFMLLTDCLSCLLENNFMAKLLFICSPKNRYRDPIFLYLKYFDPTNCVKYQKIFIVRNNSIIEILSQGNKLRN